MIDFKKLVKKQRTVIVTDFIRLFESLDRHTSHTELRIAQLQALELLSKRRNERDIVLKMSTGSGKTAVALLYLLSHMEEKEQPVVYLCPTVQLVEQVLDEATKLGIRAVSYPAGEPHPHVDGISGKAIIVCTYDKLFNAKTTFDRFDVRLRPCAMVLDDAHAGVEEIRDSFTLHIPTGELHKKVLDLLDSSCRHYNMGLWQSIILGDPLSVLEVPFWAWQPVTEEINKILSRHSEKEAFVFVWPYLRDMLRRCRCIISGVGFEIVPEVLPVHKCGAYFESKHRLFMSATLADDSILIREFECGYNACVDPILPKDDKGLGERMVIAPSLFDRKLDRSWVMQLCKKLSRKLNVVVLSHSESAARDWEAVGGVVVLGDEVSKAIRELKDNSSVAKLVVFVQRYDGLDLPDNACRILVIDGIPYGEGITDRCDSGFREAPGGVRNRLIFRIEQGMGRAVRSHADYAVVILAGPEIAHFIARREVLKAMNPDTRAQLSLALDLARLASEEGEEEDPERGLLDMLSKSLKRDFGWKQFYDEHVRKTEKETLPEGNLTNMKLAAAEREAFNMAVSNNIPQAAKILQRVIDECHLNDKEKGMFLQKYANYIYEVNPADGLEIQRSAYEHNRMALCPPIASKRPPPPAKFDVQAKIIGWFEGFENRNGTLAAIQELRAKLSYEVSPHIMEEAIKDLSLLLGAVGSRPEKEIGEGPDDLWLWPSLSFVIEVKNENKEALHKKDAGQLLLSLQWFERNYPTRKPGLPLVVAKVTMAEPKTGFPEGTRVLTPEKLQQMLDRLEIFFKTLIDQPSLVSSPAKIHELQTKMGISPEQFRGNYTVPLLTP